MSFFFSSLFWLVSGLFNILSTVLVSMIDFRKVFYRKGITHFVLIFSMCFSMCRCLFIASLVFGNEKLYVTKKGIMSTQIGFEVLKSDLLLRLLTLLICLLMLVFLKTFYTNHFNRSCVGF